MGQISSWMLRLRTYLAAGILSLTEVLEIMVLIQGLPKHGGWPVLAMSLSTDETLTFGTICERLQQQAYRLASDKSVKPTNPNNNISTPNIGSAKAITGGGSGGAGGGQAKSHEKARTPYWQGQQARQTHQDSPHESDNRSQSSNQSQPSNGKWKGKGKGKGKGSAFGKDVRYNCKLNLRSK